MSASSPLIRLGSVYGGWWVPEGSLNSKSVCYLAGVGEDVTFDLALIEKFGCHVWAMDPTPRAVSFAQQVIEPRFHFMPVGIWKEDAHLKFYSPSDETHVSHSITNLQKTQTYFLAPCQSLRSLMADNGHTAVDLLKLDIEGAETAVLADILSSGPLPAILCVEFDAHEPARRTLKRIRALKKSGYECRKIEDRNYTFELRSA